MLCFFRWFGNNQLKIWAIILFQFFIVILCVWLKGLDFDFENKCFFYFDLYSTIKYISCWKYTFFCSHVATSPLCLQLHPLSSRPSTYFTYLYTFYLQINYNRIFFLHILWYSLQYIHAYTHCLEFGQYFLCIFQLIE